MLPLRAMSLASVLLFAACSGETAKPASASPPANAARADVAPTPTVPTVPTVPTGATTPPATGSRLAGRQGELANPDKAAMVFLYLDLAGIAPPIDDWVEQDSRVLYAPAPAKAAQRVSVKAELESGIAAVRNIGAIRLSLNGAQLSEYDPTHGEFTVGALAPSSVVEFNALGQKVTLKFGNARAAQTWRVPAAEAQTIRDKVGRGGNVEMDMLLRITGVQPGMGGGSIVADVQQYELRMSHNATMIGRVQVVRP